MLQAPSVKPTALGLTAATVGGDSLGANPVPVKVRVCGSWSGPDGVNDHEGVAVNDVVEVTVLTPSKDKKI